MKSVLITGASGGLGKVLAKIFYDAGWHIALSARSASTLHELAETLKKSSNYPPQSILVLPYDLQDSQAPDLLFHELRKHWSGLTALINNAGIQGPIGNAWESEQADWEAAFRILVFAPIRLCQLAVSWMGEYNGGAIINLSGGGATAPRSGFSAYSAAKTALVRFSEILATECSRMNISVNAVAPGAMPSNMLKMVVTAGELAAGKKEFELAQEILNTSDKNSFIRAAECILFLCEPDGRKITGKLISAVWDNYHEWSKQMHINELLNSDVYTLRRITGRDRGLFWGDK